MSKQAENTYFGLAYLRREGAAVHPDDTDATLSDAAYIKQLQAYKDHAGDVGFVSRPELLNQIK